MNEEHKSTTLHANDVSNRGNESWEEPAGSPGTAAAPARAPDAPESGPPEAGHNQVFVVPPAATDRPHSGSGAEGSLAQREGLIAQEATRETVAESARAVAGPPDEAVALFERGAIEDFRSRWNEIQVAFVDEPRGAVERADLLVAETITRLTESFAAERRKLEDQWDRADNAPTETLRLALQRYRSFFNRLLTV